jgi:hypothetical protein
MKSVHGILMGGTVALLATGHFTQAAAADQRAVNDALLTQYFADINAHDVASLKDVIAENHVQRESAQGQGLAGMQAAYKHYFQMFPDFHMTLEDGIITGEVQCCGKPDILTQMNADKKG